MKENKNLKRLNQSLLWISIIGSICTFIAGKRVDTLNLLVLALLFKDNADRL